MTEQRIKSADTGKWYTGIGIWSTLPTLNTCGGGTVCTANCCEAYGCPASPHTLNEMPWGPNNHNATITPV